MFCEIGISSIKYIFSITIGQFRYLANGMQTRGSVIKRNMNPTDRIWNELCEVASNSKECTLLCNNTH